jgi:AraC-like DNA-binding protein
MPTMDALTGFLTGPRARDAFLVRSIMEPPWSVRIRDEAPLTVVAMVRGTAWLVLGSGPPWQLHPGDVAVVRGPDHYTVADSPSTPPQVIIHPGQLCTTVTGVSVRARMGLGVRTWGNSLDGSDIMLTGTYEGDGEVSRRLTDALPPFLILRAAEWDCPVIPLLAEEITKDDLGQQVVLDRLLDLLTIAVLRAWFARREAAAPAWYTAHTDPVVGKAIRLLHEDPAHPWTVAALAAATGISRAALARRFTDLVGEPPMSFLTTWRLTLAADLLQEPTATVTAVARRVGYASPFTFSTAFKRHYGHSPTAHRQSHPPAPTAAEA